MSVPLLYPEFSLLDLLELTESRSSSNFAGSAEQARQGYLREEGSLGHAYVCICRHQRRFTLSDIGPTFDQGRGEPGRHDRHMRLIIQRKTTRDWPRVASEQDADLVLGLLHAVGLG